MKSYLSTLALVLLVATIATAQEPATTKSAGATTPASAIVVPAITANSTPLELARAALAAQGGDKFKNMKSMMLTGSVDLYAPNSAQSIPGKFAMVIAGDRVRVEFDARPLFSFKQIFDGQRSYSSIPGMELPPASKFGLPVLAKFDQTGYTVSAIPDKKKLRGFRVVDAEGNTTDFYIDPANGRVMMYLTPYNGSVFGTENGKFKEVEGVLVALDFSQRIETPQGVFFAEYKVKDVKLNQPLAEDLFAIQ